MIESGTGDDSSPNVPSKPEQDPLGFLNQLADTSEASVAHTFSVGATAITNEAADFLNDIIPPKEAPAVNISETAHVEEDQNQ